MSDKKLNILVFSSLFPSDARRNAGLFVRERTFRFREFANITVVSPVPWFPGQKLIQIFVPGYRPMPAKVENQDGVDVYFPRFLSFPLLFKNKDSSLLRKSVEKFIDKLVRERKINLIDAHFSYPDGHAASIIAKKLDIPCTITMRGTELPHSLDVKKLALLKEAWEFSSHIIAVSQSLKDIATSNDVNSDKVTVVGNGIDTYKFTPLNKHEARQRLNLPTQAPVLITVGGLVYRKGFHRVIACLPKLRQDYPDIRYLIVGGSSLEGNIENELQQQVSQLGLQDNVIFCGPKKPEELNVYLSAATLFVLSTANEGWANVLLEALACETPVIATDVGGNKEVINNSELGTIMPFGNETALMEAIKAGVVKTWNKALLRNYAENNHWNVRMASIKQIFEDVTAR